MSKETPKTDIVYKKLILWIVVALGISLILYSHQMDVLLSRGIQILSGRFGSLYPIAEIFLVIIFLALRWRDICITLADEHGLTSKPLVRLLGILLALAPVAFTQIATDSIVFSVVTIVIVGYGTFLAINPKSFRIFLPYTLLYVAAILSPELITLIAGQPLVAIATFLTQLILTMTGPQVLWKAGELEFISQLGNKIRLTISPDCASISAIILFLLFCGLMHLDLKKKPSSTLKLASAGTLVLTFLNAVRISILIYTGYVAGEDALWSLHSWLGYAIFGTFYAIAMIAYLRMDIPQKLKLGQMMSKTGKIYSALDPVLISVIGFVFLTEYLLVYVAGAYGVTLALISILAIYSLIAVFKVTEPLSDALENISLLFLYIMLASALPWFYFRQDLLIPGVYSIVLALCFLRIYSRNLSFESLGFVRKKAVRDSLIGLTLGIFLGAIEYFILKPAAATPSFSYAYLLQTVVYMFFFVGLGEEVLFRALIQNSVVSMIGALPGIFWSGVIFGMMHTVWRSVPELFFTFTAGIIFGIFYHRTGSLVGPVFLHGINNVMLLAVMPYLIP